jgi:hypothetical protein
MARDLLRFVPRPTDLAKALKKIVLGGLVASAGFGANPQTASAQAVGQNVGATIVDRSKKVAKLILKLPGTASNFVAQHRSHRSHSSHRSHYSGSGGSVAAPVVRPPAEAPAPATTSARASALAVPTNTIIGEIESVDKIKKTFIFKQSETVWRTIGFRDDTKFETAAGASIRFDDFAAAANGQVPVAKGDKVELSWRISADGKMPIAVTILKKAQ